ncbi:phosphoribosylformylglycinamidine synthase subunit PurQ [Helicobacter hepaticus]|jgi:phosphoribosylformylglycinamidine synthase|uniref:Phosphoribosylformylglycinamidine synthase subunit PurQ n=1 Tax=Helicobacter hepaticus (strain ATCC 51449 / 3B1) TaxID=235279 RepID=PURQ_HELHP|nr:phosphoribosylformylglycinamidine synthase subunit PurQ [Helicobacter hepaticus]Q7VFQ4.1 RecName: Full=Phosphoribosylformylglycinamidine synthase subunit PurQ; Short=FGAM synthase; AltName: Full=Formylglycinamide ribonucleotide amidotransferase subunit I; Short=FGAR amidotransferase I; Short=FGAR-AT I; AltName: Full=Glutaminase PurQ; AltName: Full=Phosphoribosylformylglycinamidine synthase subunit I [Helicobacter hepaticus ATCC 51449]AAP78218.1 FGAM synthetase [glutamine amidotransferase domai
MSVAIVRFPGTNCEFDTQYAFSLFGGVTYIVWHQDKSLPTDCHLVVIPGGFSYGDYLRCGAIAQFSPIMRVIKDFALQGGYVLGICNGFQILCEAGLLPGALKRNINLHFISQMQSLRIVSKNNAFLRSYAPNQEIRLPIAHADGNYFIDERELLELRANEQILLEYTDNPNGSVDSIAGICNEKKNVFGLMPHPERAIEDMLGSCDGKAMLDNLLHIAEMK